MAATSDKIGYKLAWLTIYFTIYRKEEERQEGQNWDGRRMWKRLENINSEKMDTEGKK